MYSPEPSPSPTIPLTTTIYENFCHHNALEDHSVVWLSTRIFVTTMRLKIIQLFGQPKTMQSTECSDQHGNELSDRILFSKHLPSSAKVSTGHIKNSALSANVDSTNEYLKMAGPIDKCRLKQILQNGNAGFRSRCLAHAKRALCQLSYAPVVLANENIDIHTHP